MIDNTGKIPDNAEEDLAKLKAWLNESEEPDLKKELIKLLNRFSCESVSGTPDYVLAEVALDAIKSFNEAVHMRAEFRGEVVAFNPSPS